MNRLLRLLPWVFVVAFALIVEQFWGWATLLGAWQTLDLRATIAACVLIFISYCLRTVRLYDFFNPYVSGHFSTCLRLMLFHNLLNNLLPFRSGEVSFPILMKRYFDVGVLVSTPGLLLFRLLDLHVVLSIGLISAMFGLAGTGINLIVWVLVVLSPFIFYLLHRPILNWSARKKSGAIGEKLHTALDSIPDSKGVLLRCWIWSWANWLLKLIVLAWLIGQFAHLPLAASLIGAVTGELSSVLPINAPGSFGTYEAGISVGLIPYSVPTEQLAAAAVNTHLFVLIVSIIGTMIACLLPLKKRKPPLTQRQS